MKTLIENDGCKYALTTSDAPNRYGFGRVGHKGKTGAKVGGAVLGPSYPHLFCGEPTVADGVYCAKHHALCRRGLGKNERALEEMLYAVDHSQYRGKPPYADHTDPIDEELKRAKP